MRHRNCARVGTALVVTAVVCLVWLMPLSWADCAPECLCRWKQGKRAVECTYGNLSGVPGSLDLDTQVLDLSHNQQLVSLPPETFQQARLLNLQKIYLSNCRLREISSSAFVGLTNLVHLDLSHNLLTHVPAAALQHATSLLVLELSGNTIRELGAHDLSRLVNLKHLYLSGCRLHKVDAAAFDRPRLLETLTLNGNQLQRLPERTVVGLRRLSSVALQGNPWHCDCRLLPLHAWLVSDNRPSSVAPHCHTPPRLAGQPFNTLQDVEFACRPRLLPTSRRVLAAAGDNATLECRVTAVPAPNVVWYRNGRPLQNASSSPSSSSSSSFLLDSDGSGSGDAGGRAHPLALADNGNFEYVSRLVISDVRVSHSRQRFVCVAANRAGDVDANFTLTVGRRLATVLAPLDSSHVAGIVVGLLVLLVVIVAGALIAVARFRRRSHQSAAALASVKAAGTDGKSTLNGHRNMVVLLDGGINGDSGFLNDTAMAGYVDPVNPVQKPPRLSELGGVPSHHTHPSVAGLMTAPSMMAASPVAYGHTANGGGHYAAAPTNATYLGAPFGCPGDYEQSLYARGPDLIKEVESARGGETAGVAAVVPTGGSLYGTTALYPQPSIHGASVPTTVSYAPSVGGSGGGFFNPLVDDSYELRHLATDGGYSDLERLDPSIYGYPADYGLPMPEAQSQYGTLPDRRHLPPQPAPRLVSSQSPPEPAPSSSPGYRTNAHHPSIFAGDSGVHPPHKLQLHQPSSSPLSSSYAVDDRHPRSPSVEPSRMERPQLTTTDSSARARHLGVPVLPQLAQTPVTSDADAVVGGTDV